MTLADDVRAILIAADAPSGRDKEQARVLLLTRKRENLRTRLPKLRLAEGRALSLIGRVDYARIDPALVLASPRDEPVWLYLRNVISSAPWEASPGRSLHYFVMDRNSGGVMGVVCVGSDLDAIGHRDRYIGWDRAAKYRLRRMDSLANMSTCIVVEPFGRLTGGKAAAAMVVSREIADVWRRKYASWLAGCTTTSLYGRSSQYNRLPMWRALGQTPGLGVSSLSDADYALVRRYVREQGLFGGMSGHGGHYGGGGGRIGNITEAAKSLGVARPSSGMPKGVYFAEYADDARAYLRGERDEPTIDAPTMAERSGWWVERWYRMRWPKVEADVRAWDPIMYSLTQQMRGRSIDDDAPVTQTGEGGVEPSDRSTT